jgi:predicted ATPase
VFSKATRALLDDRHVLTDLGEHRLKDIAGPVAIFQLGDKSFPPLKTISNTNLPRPASSFVGREAELAQVLALIERGARLLTLTGPGGSGKTRLAIEAAATLVPDYKAGVFWVGLAALRDPALVLETVAQTLGSKDGLAEHIGERELLLLLDNLEQVVEAAPGLSELIVSCPNLTLLVTSRELLRVQGEVEYHVPPLREPEAVALFCERAQLEPDEDIRELCSRLDSLPLAVELAAARASVLSPAQMLERLAQRLDLLKGGRDADPRQQTLRATIEWSYDLFSDEEQRVFAAISVFAGGCTLEAAEEVVAADLDTLQSLVAKSLLRFSGARYWMLETIRQYAAERLAERGAEDDELRRRHGVYFTTWAERGESELMRDVAGLDRLESDHDNVRQALEWALRASEPELAMRALFGLWRFWFLRGYLDEGRRWIDRVLASNAEVDPVVRARALVGAGELAMRQGDIERARAYKEEHLAVFWEAGLEHEAARTLASLGNLAAEGGEFDRGRSLFAEALAIHRRRADDFGIAHATAGLGYLELVQDNLIAAKHLYDEALTLFRRVGNREYVATALVGLGEICTLLGELDSARAALAEGLALSVEDEMEFMKLVCLEHLARLAAAEGNADRAATLWGATESFAKAIGAAPLDDNRERFVASAKEALSEDRFDAAWRLGSELKPEAAVEYALETVRS